ncbi:MAG: hypothetical protein IPL92_03535 [Saprospiraceae bacterium]|nr:hypothetical protein [Candidatus Opimibacter iunctus]
MLKRESSALLFGNKLYIIVHQGTESIGAPTDQVFELLIPDEPCYIGSKVKEALYGFIFSKVRYGREDWKRVYDPLLLRMGFKTIKKMFDNVKIVNIYSRDTNLFILPYRNCGYNKSETRSLNELKLSADLETVSDCELGEMLIKAFDLAKLEVQI